MRIAHVTDCYLPRLGGIELHVRDLVERQRSAGNDVTVITSTRTTTPESGESPRVIRLDSSRSRPGGIGYLRSPGIREVLRDGAYDVVHLHASSGPLSY